MVLYQVDFDTYGYAAREHVGLEVAARDLRYAWFAQLVKQKAEQELKKAVIAVGHHAEDQSETFFLQLLRGAGLEGLSGMKLENGHVVRPLLEVSRAAIEQYVVGRGESYCIDSTNGDRQYRRNKLRIDVLPQLRAIHPQFDKLLNLAMARMGEAASVMRAMSEEWAAQHVEQLPYGERLSFDALKTDGGLWREDMETLLYHLLSVDGFSSKKMAEIAEGIKKNRVGAQYLSRTHELFVAKGGIEWGKREERDWVQRVEGEHISLPNGGELYCEVCKGKSVVVDGLKAGVKREVLQGELVVRKVAEGDRFVPFGMRGSKLVSDYLSDRHLSRLARKNSVCVCDAEGIVWLVGHTVAQRAAVDEDTAMTLLMEYRHGNGGAGEMIDE